MRLLALLSAAAAYGAPDEAAVRSALASGGRTVQLPAGNIEISAPIVVPPGKTVRGHPNGTVLRASTTFRGVAILRCESHSVIEQITIDGNREAFLKPVGLPPSDRSFASYYDRNGILLQSAEEVILRDIHLSNIAGFAVLVSASKQVMLQHLSVASSGSLNSKGRNNTTGGILIEEGSSHFSVRDCRFNGIRGNGVWTHSRYTSRRNGPGTIAVSSFEEIGRDAIQVGHATRVMVVGNRGTRIGYPHSVVDVEGRGTPVAIDTAGNVDAAAYLHNTFSEVNGKCIDLDGFHDGEVRGNRCTNSRAAGDYPFGHYGIVFNNTNPDMQSRNITVSDNVIDGTKFGGIFVIGTGHIIQRNRLLRLNLAGCPESHAQFGCIYDNGEPDLLQTGIYLGSKAERPDIARRNTIRNNVISGYGMKQRCIRQAPDVKRSDQVMENNTCTDR